MASALDIVTAILSTFLRIGTYFFLRWIPGTFVPDALLPVFVGYCAFFAFSALTSSPFEVVSEEVDVITKEILTQGSDSEPDEQLRREADAQNEPLKELDVVVTVEEEEKPPQRWSRLLWGVPNPTSGLWTVVTFTINLALVAMAYDLIYRGPIFYASEDVSFARVGYVSPNSARVLIREPRLDQLPIYLSYRYADPPPAMESGFKLPDSAWKSGGVISWLSNDTDYTKTMEISSLEPDTRYEYAFSNNHSGHFTTAPNAGHVSWRNDGKFTFVHSSCIKPRFPYSLFSHPLSIHGYRHLGDWIPRLKAHFMLFLGDFIYVDVPKRHGADVETYRREYRQMYASPDWPVATEDLPWLHVLDDHEIQNDWAANTTGVYAAAAEPWMHYHVGPNPPPVSKHATYFSFTQGPATFFMLDTRRHRTGAHISDANDAGKSMLGETQLRHLLVFLRTPPPAGVRWKFIITSVPFTKNWRFGSEDTWGGFLAERTVVLEAMWDAIAAQGVGIVVLSGDRHEFAATRFPAPRGGRWDTNIVEGSGGTAVYEFSSSPLSMFYLPYRTYEQRDEEDVAVRYIPDGNSKFGAVEITNPPASDQSVLHYRLIVDGQETWSHVVTTPSRKK